MRDLEILLLPFFLSVFIFIYFVCDIVPKLKYWKAIERPFYVSYKLIIQHKQNVKIYRLWHFCVPDRPVWAKIEGEYGVKSFVSVRFAEKFTAAQGSRNVWGLARKLGTLCMAPERHVRRHYTELNTLALAIMLAFKQSNKFINQRFLVNPWSNPRICFAAEHAMDPSLRPTGIVHQRTMKRKIWLGSLSKRNTVLTVPA